MINKVDVYFIHFIPMLEYDKYYSEEEYGCGFFLDKNFLLISSLENITETDFSHKYILENWWLNVKNTVLINNDFLSKPLPIKFISSHNLNKSQISTYRGNVLDKLIELSSIDENDFKYNQIPETDFLNTVITKITVHVNGQEYKLFISPNSKSRALVLKNNIILFTLGTYDNDQLFNESTNPDDTLLIYWHSVLNKITISK